MSAAPGWLRDVHPPVPEAFTPWLALPPGRRPDADGFAAAAEERLARVLDAGGREREGAFDLLAADGFATCACERALDDDVPEERLVTLTHRIGALLP